MIIQKIHIMGAAGSGASAIFGIAKGYGYAVSGCDLAIVSSYTKNLNLKIIKGHDESHIDNIDSLIVSPAILKRDPKNPEIEKAKEQNLPIYTWQQLQGKFLQRNKFVISIAGAYGKSTTTAMVAKMLTDCGLDPTCEIGAVLLEWGKNFRVGKSKYYVNEADEYNDNFLSYKPDIAIILNIEWDHPDYFKNEESVFNSYTRFVKNIKRRGYLIIADTPKLAKLASSAAKDVKVVKIGKFKKIKLPIIGDFRQENVGAALTIAKLLKIDLKGVVSSLENFGGVGRRLEYKGLYRQVKFFDDYAVQPYTIMTTANALKKKFKSKYVTLVLEPHTYSRIKSFFDDFEKSLKQINVDEILITDIYAARELNQGNRLAQNLAKKIGTKAKFTGSIAQTAEYIRSKINDFEVVCSMGAGDVYRLYDLIKEVN